LRCAAIITTLPGTNKGRAGNWAKTPNRVVTANCNTKKREPVREKKLSEAVKVVLSKVKTVQKSKKED